MTCCEDARMEIKAPISLGKGSLPVRVKALGNSGWRASAKNSAELMRSVSDEKMLVRVNPAIQSLKNPSKKQGVRSVLI